MKTKRKKRKMKLQHKILATNMFFFVLPCLVVCLSIVSLIHAEGNRRLNQARIVVLNQIDGSLDQYLNSILLRMENILGDYEMNRLISKIKFENEYEEITTKNSIGDFLKQNMKLDIDKKCDLQILGENDYNYSVSENVSHNSTIYPNLERLKEESWFSLLNQKSRIRYIPTYQSKEFSEMEKNSAIHAVRLIKNYNSGRSVGIVDVNITHDDIQEIFQSGVERDDQEVMLIDTDGNVVTSTDTSMIEKKISSEDYLQKIINHNYGYFQAKVNGVNSQVYFVTNASTNWKIVMYEKEQGMAWISNKGYVWIVLAIVMCVVLVFVMSIYDSRYISKPVQKLKRDMNNVYKGDLSVRTEIEDVDEFSELSIQFNRMIEKIEQLIEQLKEKDEEKRVLELKALQAQINPHFLYNTLASIRFLIDMGMEDKAGESLMALGKLLRRTFSDYRKLIPIKEEIQSLENYLVLMNNRYQNTFEWIIDVDEEIQECLVPRISIQPLVENSISHGFSDKESMGHIWIRGERKEDKIIIAVEDDGLGADMEKIKRILDEVDVKRGKEQVSSIGMKNVQERIQLLFGENYGLRVSQRADGGIRIELCIPVRLENESMVQEG